MTRIIYKLDNRTAITVESDGRVTVDVPINKFAAIGPEFRTFAEQAIEQPGVPITVPDKGAFVPRPRNSKVYSIAQ